MDRIFGRNEGSESRDFTSGRGYGEEQQFYDDDFSDTGSEWNSKSDFRNRRPGPPMQAQRNRPTSQRASDNDRDFSSRQNARQDYFNDNRKSEGSMWNESFTSERDRNQYGRYNRNTSGGFFGKGPKGWKRSDDRIKDDVSEALYRDYHVDASEIEVDVKEGVVTLSGTVESRDAKRSAEECIENLSGVIDVHNRIRIQAKDNVANLRTGNDSQEKRALS